MTNREWLNNLNNVAMAYKILPPGCECEYCIINANCNHIAGDCINKLVEWLNKKHIEPMPTLKVGDIVQTKPYCRYVAIDPIKLVRAESKKQVFLCDIGDIVMIWRSEGEEYQCIWEG